MKKSKKIATAIIATTVILSSCATTKLKEDEELVEYIKYDYEVKEKKELTEAELREDCDMLKYIVYNAYAGIDEAIAAGFDLDATIEMIYGESLSKKSGLGTINASEFSTIVRRTFSKELKNNDQHIGIGGSLRDSYCLYYTDVYFEKTGDKYFVKKIQLDKNRQANKAAAAEIEKIEAIKPGMEYTGTEANLYEMLTDEGILYRYGLITSKRVKTILLPVDGEKITVPAKTEKSIPTKYDWSGLKSTDKTVYVSLGDCSQATGISNRQKFSNDFWDKYLKEVAEATKGKEQIIFDLRSNPGGYIQFPVRILSALYYNQHMEEDFQKNMRAFMLNEVGKDCVELVSPILMQSSKDIYDKNGYYSDLFSEYRPEIQEYHKNYWKHMKMRPIRSHIPQGVFDTSFETFPEPDFKGDIYVLINHNSGSAAEYGTQAAYLLQNKEINVHIVGENSWGGMKYGGMSSWSLPNSGVYLYIGTHFGESPYAAENPNWHGEGYGWFPDYWATNDTILNTLEMLTKDEELKEVLIGLNENQL